MEFIARTQLTGTAASVSFATGLSGYTKFFLWVYVVKDANVGEVRLRLNNDSGANYATQSMDANGATISASRATGVTYSGILGVYANIAANGTMLAVVEISKPVAGEVARITGRNGRDAETVGIRFETNASEWTNTADLINRIDVYAVTNNITTGSRFLLAGSRD